MVYYPEIIVIDISILVKPLVAPSILSADFAKLGEDCSRIVRLGADWLHVDIMDGHFVPNITIGPPVVKSLRKHTTTFLDCHLMVSDPLKWVRPLSQAGADQYTFHLEATNDPKTVIQAVKETGMKVGIAIKPNTPVESLFPFCPLVDMVLVMTVEPGFGGQSFMNDMMAKVITLRKKFSSLNIQVDGGIDINNIDTVVSAGANVIVSGTGIFKTADPEDVIKKFKQKMRARF